MSFEDPASQVYNKSQNPYYDELRATVRAMTARGKGLLAADESPTTAGKRLASIQMENTPDNRRKYRAIMVGTEGLSNYISGIIFHEETLTQNMDDGTPFPQYCQRKGIVPGIKTDLGLAPLMEGVAGEEQTLGLDNYVKRAQGYYEKGARFCKWRNVYKIQNGTVSEALIFHNAHTLARYALLSQAAVLVPIVEPEVMIDGTHTLAECQAVSQRVWSAVGAALQQHGVALECMILKPNMIVPGAESGETATPAQVATATTVTLARSFPAAIPGVTFLSGGLSEVQASEFLNAMNVASLAVPRPWSLSFSYARALQASALKAWGGKDENFPAGRKVLLHRAEMNSLAQQGKYDRGADDKVSESLFVKGHTY